MAAQTGRTHSKWMTLFLSDSGGTLRQIPVKSIGGLGITYDEVEILTTSDAIKGKLPSYGNLELTVDTAFDNTATTGSHTILSAINGATTPLSFDVQCGIRHAWTAGEPQFGITKGATDGVLVTSYVFKPEDGSASFKLVLNPGSAAPAWGTAAES